MSKGLSGRPAIILLVDDDPGDQELTRRCFEKHRIRNDLHIVGDGEEALDYLLRRGAYQDPESSPRPDLVLLDLNMPKLDGKQVLAQIRAHDELHGLPVVIMTTSDHDVDVARSYDLGANSYVVKPLDISQFSQVLDALGNYWFEVVVLPHAPAGLPG